MFSERTINELEEQIQNRENRQFEIETPSGEIFTVYLQQGRAERLSERANRTRQSQERSRQLPQERLQTQSQGRSWTVTEVAETSPSNQ